MNQTMFAQWETGKKAGTKTDNFCRDNEMVFQLASVAFKDSSGNCHFDPKKGMKRHSSHQSFFACKGQFLALMLPNRNVTCLQDDPEDAVQRGVPELELRQAL